MKYLFLLLLLIGNLHAQDSTFVPALVSMEDFEDVMLQAKEHRKERLVDWNTFLEMSQDKNTIILDARSGRFFAGRHVKGAINLSFTEFTQESLAAVIPNFETRILIYCNNNFGGDEINLASKVVIDSLNRTRPLTLALNIPTYINLFGYGYKNVYELSEFLNIHDKRVKPFLTSSANSAQQNTF